MGGPSLASKPRTPAFRPPSAHASANAPAPAPPQDGKLLGMGSGQPNRVNSVRIALEKAGGEVQVCMGASVCVCV
jgi:AICAR transformylase/IMP cyclohydrolase PurH